MSVMAAAAGVDGNALGVGRQELCVAVRFRGLMRCGRERLCEVQMQGAWRSKRGIGILGEVLIKCC